MDYWLMLLLIQKYNSMYSKESPEWVTSAPFRFEVEIHFWIVRCQSLRA